MRTSKELWGGIDESSNILNGLWQEILKRHMETNHQLRYGTVLTITDEEWLRFVDENEDAFADAVSLLANEWFTDWKAEQ